MGKRSIVFTLALQTLIVIIFLMCFYLAYSRRVEHKAMVNQVNFVVDEIAESVNVGKLFTTNRKTTVTAANKALNNVLNNVEKSSGEPRDDTKYILITAGIIAFLIILYYIAYNYAKSRGVNVSFDHHMGESIITLMVVAFVETFFLSTILEKYIYPGDIDMVARVEENLKTKSK